VGVGDVTTLETSDVVISCGSAAAPCKRNRAYATRQCRRGDIVASGDLKNSTVKREPKMRFTERAA
jgi:hypothetical protein